MLESLDLTQSLSTEEYEERLKPLQLDLVLAQRRLAERGIAVVIVFEGMDAAGKGGAIKRLTTKLDPRGYEVLPIGPPTEEELRHHYLWRFWTQLPSYGRLTIFDRSWYGRVLVERVEGITPKARWQQAYSEIVEFERSLVDDEYIVLKFWLHISEKEQLRRFKAREEDPYRRWKITKEDWRNRDKWDDYVAAAEDMFEYTSTARGAVDRRSCRGQAVRSDHGARDGSRHGVPGARRARGRQRGARRAAEEGGQARAWSAERLRSPAAVTARQERRAGRRAASDGLDDPTERLQRVGRDLFASDAVTARGGNLSVRDGEPDPHHPPRCRCSGVSTDDDIVVTFLEPGPADTECSTELVVHRAIYHGTDASAIVHAHTTHTTYRSLIEDEIRPVDSDARYVIGEVIPVLESLVGDRVGGGRRDARRDPRATSRSPC